LSTRQVVHLRRVSDSLGINSSELLRRLLDGWIAEREARREGAVDAAE
jgi:hypothetical protein